MDEGFDTIRASVDDVLPDHLEEWRLVSAAHSARATACQPAGGRRWCRPLQLSPTASSAAMPSRPATAPSTCQAQGDRNKPVSDRCHCGRRC